MRDLHRLVRTLKAWAGAEVKRRDVLVEDYEIKRKGKITQKRHTSLEQFVLPCAHSAYSLKYSLVDTVNAGLQILESVEINFNPVCCISQFQSFLGSDKQNV